MSRWGLTTPSSWANRQFTLAKKQWDSVVLERIEQACDPAWSADVAAVVMQEGLAHICLVTPQHDPHSGQGGSEHPRKRKGNCSQHDRALERFYEQVDPGHPAPHTLRCCKVRPSGQPRICEGAVLRPCFNRQ